jgi:tRNA(Ile)-lysidine synthase
MDLGAGFSCEYGPKEGVCFFRTGNRRVVKNEIDSSLVTRILPVPGEVSFPFWGQRPVRFEAKVLEHGDFQLKSLFDVARDSENGSLLGSVSFFDAEAIEHGVLVVRQRAEGDVVDVWKRGRRKLKKLLQEKRVPLFLRAAYPVLTLNEEIIWVPGISRSRHAGVNLEAKKIVQFSVSGVE